MAALSDDATTSADDDTDEPYPLPAYVPFLAGLIGGTIACLCGRERTRIDNFCLGSLLTGLTAFRDPRPTTLQTIIIASVEGGITGGMDRVIPVLKEKFLPSGDDDDTATSTAVQPAAAGLW